MLNLDHLAVSAVTLEEGVAHVEAALGVPLQGGGQHVKMGTHNRLLSLGDLYLEVIAPDPSLPRPARPRWFDLDRFTGPPRPTVWVLRSDDLTADLTAAPAGTGRATPMARGDLTWTIAIPDDGILPFANTHPSLIQWDAGAPHPASRLTDRGIRLTRLEVSSPQAAALTAALSPRFHDPRVVITEGPAALRASFATPHGIRHL